MKPYPAYKDSGIEWLGKIPKDWNNIRLKYEISYLKGKNPEELTFDETGEIYLSMDYLRGSPKQIYYVKDNNGYLKIKDDEILLLWDGSNAGEFIKSKAGILSSTMALLVIREGNLEYAWYFLKSLERQLKESTIGMGIPHVNGDEFGNQIFLIPSQDEQKIIATYLDRKIAQIDDLIDKKERMIELLKEERTAIINQAVTKGLNPNVEMKDPDIEWLGKIPKHWEVNRLKTICSLTYGDSLSNEDRIEGDIPVYGSNGVVGYHNKAITHKPCIIVGRKGSFGKVNFSDTECFPIDTTYFIDNRFAKCDLKWLNYVLLLLELDRFSNDTGVPGLNRDDAHNKMVPVPNTDEQRTIAIYLDRKTTQIDAQIEKITKTIELLKEYRTALISEAVTGKIDIREE